ncbi:MAG: hypothetical protein QXR64_08130 [Pyrobaculum sp.]
MLVCVFGVCVGGLVVFSAVGVGAAFVVLSCLSLERSGSGGVGLC